MFEALHSLEIPRIGSPVFGALFPAFVFIIAFLAAFLLYRHFSRESKGQ